MNERERLVGLWRAARILDELESLTRREPLVRATRSILLSRIAQYTTSSGVDSCNGAHRQWSLRYALEEALIQAAGDYSCLWNMLELLDSDYDPSQENGGRVGYVIDPGASD